MNLLGFDVKRSKWRVTALPDMGKIPFSAFVSATSSMCLDGFSPNLSILGHT